jgi:hypothetical protein
VCRCGMFGAHRAGGCTYGWCAGPPDGGITRASAWSAWVSVCGCALRRQVLAPLHTPTPHTPCASVSAALRVGMCSHVPHTPPHPPHTHTHTTHTPCATVDARLHALSLILTPQRSCTTAKRTVCRTPASVSAALRVGMCWHTYEQPSGRWSPLAIAAASACVDGGDGFDSLLDTSAGVR